jgi:hypothetical protein
MCSQVLRIKKVFVISIQKLNPIVQVRGSQKTSAKKNVGFREKVLNLKIILALTENDVEFT